MSNVHGQSFYNMLNEFRQCIAAEFVKVNDIEHNMSGPMSTGQLESMLTVKRGTLILRYYINYSLLYAYKNNIQQYAKKVAAKIIDELNYTQNYDKQTHTTLQSNY